MITVRAVIGGILLFLGREANFLFAGAFAALIGYRMAPVLPAHWPDWSGLAFIAGLAIVGMAVPLIHERAGYVLSGFLAGGYIIVEYFEPGVPTLPIFLFLIGSVIGAVIMGVFTEWALMIVSSVVGAYAVVEILRVSIDAKAWIGAGLFMFGALTQVILRRIQQK